MRDRYRLQSLKDAELIAALPLLAQRDNEHTADLLAHLAELDERKLYLGLGFRSIWEYCTLGLGFCETTAWRRYTAARVCRRFPEAFAKVARGELHLSALAAVAKHLTAENSSQLFEVCQRQSIRRVEELIAARFPVLDIRDSIRRLPARGSPEISNCEPTSPSESRASGAGCDWKQNPLQIGSGREQGPNLDAIAAAGTASPPPAGRASAEPLSADRFGIRFTADAEFLDLLEQVRDLAGHRDANGDLLSTMKAALAAYRGELLKDRFAVGRKPRVVVAIATTTAKVTRSREAAKSSTTRRRPPSAVARTVYERDGGQCTYVAPDGRRCSSRRLLELDHIEPHAAGGSESSDNLRLRCRAHNQHYARQYFGRGYMRSVMKRVRAQRVRSA
jgi:5-methylcytosine-specific restriction endonuclease McrA